MYEPSGMYLLFTEPIVSASRGEDIWLRDTYLYALLY